MDGIVDARELMAYLFGDVLLTMTDGRTVRGRLDELAVDTLVVDGVQYALSDVRDVEHVGLITDHHTYKGGGEIGCYSFGEDDLAEDFDRSKLIYEDFDCFVACHLVCKKSVRAKDVRLLSTSYRLPDMTLKGKYILRMTDGSIRTGHIVKGAEKTAGNGLRSGYREAFLEDDSGTRHELDLSCVADILPMPLVNNHIYVDMNDGNCMDGLVVAVSNEAAGIITPNGPKLVRYRDMARLRYLGNIYICSRDSRGASRDRNLRSVNVFIAGPKTGNMYLIKTPTLDPSFNESWLSANRAVIFSPGICGKGLVARDVSLPENRMKQTIRHAVGIILAMPNTEKNIGYDGTIGAEFYSRQYMDIYEKKHGTKLNDTDQVKAFAPLANIDFTWEANRVYVVDYTYAEEDREEKKRALCVSKRAEFRRDMVSRLRIDETGELHVLPASVAYLHIAIAQRLGVSLNMIDGSEKHGIVTAYDGPVITLCYNGDDGEEKTEEVPEETVSDVRYTGMITNELGSGQGMIVNLWFHVHELRKAGDSIYLKQGRSLDFTVRQSDKGNGWTADDIVPLHEEMLHGFLLKYDGETCVIQPGDERDEAAAESYRITGLIPAIEDKLVRLRLDGTRKYPITYMLRQSGLRKLIVLKYIATSRADMVSEEKPVPAIEHGYIVKYIRSKGFGFIVKEENLQKSLKTHTGDIYFRDTDVKDISAWTLDTMRNYYPVEYENGSLPNTAKNIHILEEKSISKAPQPSILSQEPPEFMAGESIILQMPDGTNAGGRLQSSDAGTYVLDDGRSFSADEATLWRFGMVTACDMDKGTATISGLLLFDLDVAEKKLINVLHSSVRNLVIYTCRDGRVTSVERVPKWAAALVRWERVTVTSGKPSDLSFSAGDRRYRLAVSADAYTLRLLKDGRLAGIDLYVRDVVHPSAMNGGIALVHDAAEVRVSEQDADILYDAGMDTFLGRQDKTTVQYPLFGSPILLHSRLGQKQRIRFDVSADGCELEARLVDETMDEETQRSVLEEIKSENKTLAGMTHESLVAFLIGGINPAALELRDVELDDTGMPSGTEEAQKAYVQLMRKKTDEGRLAAAMIAIRFPGFNLGGAGHKVIDRDSRISRQLADTLRRICRKQEVAQVLVTGEHAYYLSVLERYPAAGYSGPAQFCTPDCLYRLFMTDFGEQQELRSHVSGQHAAGWKHVEKLLARECLKDADIAAHLMLIKEESVERVCGILEKNPSAVVRIRQVASQAGVAAGSRELYATVAQMREKYRDLRMRFHRKFAEIAEGGAVSGRLRNETARMREGFMKLTTHDDESRFMRLFRCCSDVGGYTNKPGFEEQEQVLKKSYREAYDLSQEILSHPTREAAELLMPGGTFKGSLMERLCDEISGLLNQLYQGADAQPDISCVPNEAVLREGQETIALIISNGSRSQNRQPADDVVMHFESFDTEALSIQETCSVGRVAAGGRVSIEVPVKLGAKSDNGIVSLGWSAEYDYAEAFRDGSVVTTRHTQNGGVIDLQYMDEDDGFEKDRDAKNPYSEPAQGKPLEDASMFYGHKEEGRAIRDSIIRETGGKLSMVPGSAVIVHGQKKSGKTSLVNQVKNFINDDPALSKQAIMINFANILTETGGKENLSGFQHAFYADIMIRFEDEVHKHHKDVFQLLDEAHIEIPDLLDPEYNEIWPAKFDQFFSDFARIDGGRHTLVIFMDEFTLFCSAIFEAVREDPTNKAMTTLPGFIKTFSQRGFVQVIIGHESMMRAFDSLGVLNHTAEFATAVEVGPLDHDSAASLVTEPMERAFGYNPYGTELGRQAVERLLDLSGCSPTYLMRLCNRMFIYYVSDKCPARQILTGDVETMLRSFVATLLIKDFDMLLTEDGDESVEPEKRKTYQYLQCVALLSFDSYDRRTADSNEATRKMTERYGYNAAVVERVRNVLEARRVISITEGGRVKISAGLFSEFIRQKNGI